MGENVFVGGVKMAEKAKWAEKPFIHPSVYPFPTIPLCESHLFAEIIGWNSQIEFL